VSKAGFAASATAHSSTYLRSNPSDRPCQSARSRLGKLTQAIEPCL
jgi:hypothetical protein